mmetsp:Transcript_51136/g.146821  ORF Transcript_51136/g.146821 Transcript_51136/m.146821 type:complete len:289 (+) Transcript_51136:594-1460(+)
MQVQTLLVFDPEPRPQVKSFLLALGEIEPGRDGPEAAIASNTTLTPKPLAPFACIHRQSKVYKAEPRQWSARKLLNEHVAGVNVSMVHMCGHVLHRRRQLREQGLGKRQRLLKLKGGILGPCTTCRQLVPPSLQVVVEWLSRHPGHRQPHPPQVLAHTSRVLRKQCRYPAQGALVLIVGGAAADAETAAPPQDLALELGAGLAGAVPAEDLLYHDAHAAGCRHRASGASDGQRDPHIAKAALAQQLLDAELLVSNLDFLARTEAGLVHGRLHVSSGNRRRSEAGRQSH